MTESRAGTRTLAAAALAALALMLTGCFLTPGKFASSLDLRRGGEFTFVYDGEIHMLALSEMARKGSKGSAVFKPEPCQTNAGAPRECSASELDRQMRAWEARQAAGEQRKEAEAEQFAMMFGGIDPSDPETARALAERLRQQRGWERVDYRGDGRFDVRYRVTGSLDHDFVFPVIEGLPATSPFVLVALRENGSVRIDTPGFAGPAGSYQGILQAMAMEGARQEADAPQLPQPDGVFTITTDGALLANNTENGPAPDTSGQRLEWNVSPRVKSAPTALIDLTRP